MAQDDVPQPELLQRLDRIEALLQSHGNGLSLIYQAAFAFGVSFPDDTVLVKTSNCIFLADKNDLVITPHLICFREWEPELDAYLASLTNANTVFIDVGASIGYFSCNQAARIGQSGNGRVFAFEPNPRSAMIFRKNLLSNWSMAPIKLFEAAAGSESGVGKLNIPPFSPGNASMGPVSAKQETIAIEVVKLDTALADVPYFDVMKIDVEGFEPHVLMGGAELIRRSPNPTIVVEWSITHLARSGLALSEVLALMDQLGLAAYELPAPAAMASAELTEIPFEGLANLQFANIVLRRRPG